MAVINPIIIQSGGIDPSDANAIVGDVLTSKTFYAGNETKKTGTMINRGTVSTDITTKAQEVTIAAGKHSGSGKVKISATEQAKIIAGNIKKNVSILGITGTLEGGGAVAEGLTITTPSGQSLAENDTGSASDSLQLEWRLILDNEPYIGNLQFSLSQEDLGYGSYVSIDDTGYIDAYNNGENNGSQSEAVTVYVETENGAYSDSITIYVYTGSCFVEGTLIALADGSKKPVEDIDYADKLLAWDFDRGEQCAADILWIAKEAIAPCFWRVCLSDGTLLQLVGAKGKSHRLFNLERGAFVYPQDFLPNEHTVKADGTLVTISECVKSFEAVKYYNLATTYRLDNYANDVLCGCRFTNAYPIQSMKYVKDDRVLHERSEYPLVPDKYFEGLRLAEQPTETGVGDVNYYATTQEHVLHNYIEHERDYKGKRDYKTWQFKEGK